MNISSSVFDSFALSECGTGGNQIFRPACSGGSLATVLTPNLTSSIASPESDQQSSVLCEL